MDDRKLFEPVAAGHPTVEELREICEGSPTWMGVSDTAFEEFAAAYDLIQIPGGELLFAQGDPHAFEYAVLHGRLRAVRRDASGRPAITYEFGRGEDIGLQFLFGDNESICDVYAIRDSLLVRLSVADFERLAPRHPDAVLNLARAMVAAVRRTIENAERPSSDVVNVAVIPVASHPRLTGVVSALVEAAPASVSVSHLTRARVEDALGADVLSGTDTAAWQRMIAWLEEQERTHRLVLYECDPEPTSWNEGALRQADRILLCAPAGTTPDTEHIRSLLSGVREGVAAQRVDLVLVHEPDTEMPTGTAAWLDAAPVTRHFHLRAGKREDFARLGRWLTGRAVGVVLGGGGARGIGHVGVLQALMEAGIPIDGVAGTSIGSIVAAAQAMGWSSEEMRDEFRRTFPKNSVLIDLTFPVVALNVGSKLDRILQRLFGGLQIEDLWTPFFCNSTSLEQHDSLVHQRGELRESIRASISLPGIFPPVRSGDDLLVDGGVLDNLPIATMARLGDGGPVIAVDVSDSRPAALDPAYRDTASGWRLLGRKLNPFADDILVPNIFDVITRCIVVGSGKEVERTRDQAALYLKPSVEEFGTLDFAACDRISRVAYESTKQQLDGSDDVAEILRRLE